MTQTSNEYLNLAIEAVEMGKTRGQFIRENSTLRDCRETLQEMSDAYSEAMRILQMESR